MTDAVDQPKPTFDQSINLTPVKIARVNPPWALDKADIPVDEIPQQRNQLLSLEPVSQQEAQKETDRLFALPLVDTMRLKEGIKYFKYCVIEEGSIITLSRPNEPDNITKHKTTRPLLGLVTSANPNVLVEVSVYPYVDSELQDEVETSFDSTKRLASRTFGCDYFQVGTDRVAMLNSSGDFKRELENMATQPVQK
jgi:hypothetical protein